MNGVVVSLEGLRLDLQNHQKLGDTSGRGLVEWLVRQTTSQRSDCDLICSFISYCPEIP
jgi:hypothetical protein